MELQLGLAPPNTSPMKWFDLNINDFETQDMLGNMKMEAKKKNGQQKRSFGEAFELEHDHGSGIAADTLPLLLWNGQPNEEDDLNGLNNRLCKLNVINKDDDQKEDLLVGWPPIKSWRAKILHNYLGGGDANFWMPGRECSWRNSTYVKVKMEGVAIGRKVDLRLFHSYETLTNALLSMFSINQTTNKDDMSYTLLYLDKEGDWLFAGDVPWESFAESAQRIEILKSAGGVAG